MEIVSYLVLCCGRTYSVIKTVSFDNFIIDWNFDPSTIGATQIGHGLWTLMLEENVIDTCVPGCGANALGNVMS